MKVQKLSTKSWNDLGTSSGAQPNSNPDSTLRSRSPQIGPTSETDALNALNTRSPAADIAQDWQSDNSSPINRRPSSRIHSPHLVPTSEQRNQEVEEVYGVLRRASTRGKRRESREHDGSGNGTTIPIIEEPSNQSQASFNYHDYAREVNGQGPAPNPNRKGTPGGSPPRGSSTEGGQAGAFGASYNPYVTAAPKYEYPPSSPQRSQPAAPTPAPVTSSSVYPSPLRTTATTAQQEQSMNPASSSPPRPNRKNAYAAELDGMGREY